MALGKALRFGGTNEYIERTQAIVTAYPFTLACWFRMSGVGAAMTMVGISDFSQALVFYIIGTNNVGKPFISFSNGGYNEAVSAVEYDDNAWHLIIGTFVDNTHRYLYIDGDNLVASNEVTSVTFNSLVDTYSVARLSRGAATSYYTGDIDEPTAWDIALDATARTARYAGGVGVRMNTVETANVVLNLPLDEGTGTNAEDFSGNGWDGTLYNMEEADWIEGKVPLADSGSLITWEPEFLVMNGGFDV